MNVVLSSMWFHQTRNPPVDGFRVRVLEVEGCPSYDGQTIVIESDVSWKEYARTHQHKKRETVTVHEPNALA